MVPKPTGCSIDTVGVKVYPIPTSEITMDVIDPAAETNAVPAAPDASS